MDNHNTKLETAFHLFIDFITFDMSWKYDEGGLNFNASSNNCWPVYVWDSHRKGRGGQEQRDCERVGGLAVAWPWGQIPPLFAKVLPEIPLKSTRKHWKGG